VGIGSIRACVLPAAPGFLFSQRQHLHLVRSFLDADPRGVLGAVGLGILPLAALGGITKLAPQFFCPV